MISLADQMGLPQEQGRMKWLTNYIRFGSNILDMIPALGAEDIPAAVLTGAAGVIDVGNPQFVGTFYASQSGKPAARP